ncbi:hypothetical protein INT47_011393 [Mucor saturninus]|uniref:Uncharacterized protein n=1 Tax=Mucor saturninus TaxID=64648 RepID=A0A8H7QSD0_9FUNG|nr:hypothetical protein INT47_011393 [Mucor saturninus]
MSENHQYSTILNIDYIGLLLHLKNDVSNMAKFMSEDALPFWHDIIKFRQQSGIDYSDSYEDWDNLIIYVFKYCENISVICQKVDFYLDCLLQGLPLVGVFGEYSLNRMLQDVLTDITLRVSKMKSISYMEPPKKVYDSTIASLTEDNVAIRCMHLDFNRKVSSGEVKATRPSQKTFDDMEKSAYQFLAACTFVLIPLLMFDSSERTLYKYLIAGGCLLLAWFVRAPNKDLRCLKWAELEEDYMKIIGYLLDLVDYAASKADSLNYSQNDSLLSYGSIEMLRDTFRNIHLMSHAGQHFATRLMSAGDPNLVSKLFGPE